MADFTQIKQEIDNNVNTNGENAITGAILNETLKDMVDNVNEKKQDLLIDGKNIRTLNGQSLLGSGDIETGAGHELPAMKTIRPAFLSAGDKVAIVACSSAGTAEMVTAAQTLFGDTWGLTVTLDYYAAPTSDYIATAVRIVKAIEDDTVKAIIALRGGNGSDHVVDYIPKEVIAAHPKWFVGYSDVCGYLSIYINAGVMALHGPMCASIVNHPDDDGSLDKLHDVLFGVSGYNTLSFTDGESNNVIGTVTGRLVGGNTATLQPYLDGDRSPFQFNDDIILLLEETDGLTTNNYYRRLKAYKYAFGNRVKAILVGDLPLSVSGGISGDKYTLTKGVFWDIPIAFTYNIGHGDVNWPVVLGSVATLEISTTSNSTLTFCEESAAVSYTLDNVEVLDGQGVAAVGKPYYARLAPTGSCLFGSVAVIMDGVDVTSSVWTPSTGEISVDSVTGDIFVLAVGTNALPTGYRFVDYITCDGNQYFDAGFKGSSSLPFDVTIEATDRVNLANYNPFGGRTSTSSKRFDVAIGQLNAYQVPINTAFFGFGSTSSYNSIAVQLGKVRMMQRGGKCLVKNDGNNILLIDRSNQSFTGSYNVYIGCVNTAGTRTGFFVGNLYRMRFGNTADFVPCVRESDGVAGMYDVIREAFFASSGNDFIID